MLVGGGVVRDNSFNKYAIIMFWGWACTAADRVLWARCLPSPSGHHVDMSPLE